MLFPYIQPDMVGVVKGVHVIFSLTPTHNGELSSAHLLLTAVSTFFVRCSRAHLRPDSSTTLLIPGMFQNFELKKSSVDDFDTGGASHTWYLKINYVLQSDGSRLYNCYVTSNLVV